MADKPKEYSQKEYEKLGRMLVDISQYGFKPGKGYYWSSFVKGVLAGFGGVIGATVVVALVIWFLGLFDQLSFAKGFIETLTNTISQAK